jgi:hypothetical protein
MQTYACVRTLRCWFTVFKNKSNIIWVNGNSVKCLNNLALRPEDVWGSECIDPPFLYLGIN